jgi:hypothetical protein
VEGGSVPGNHGGGNGRDRTDAFNVDPDAVPGLRDAFADALTKVDRQLALADRELRLTAWAKDPISQDASVLFNDRSVEADECAVETLRAYREQLDVAVRSLAKTAEQYQVTDEESLAPTEPEG